MKNNKPPYFINPKRAPKFYQMEGIETIVLTGLHGEKMMMVLNIISPGRSIPLHSHPNEQIGMVYSGKGILMIGGEERMVKRGDFYRVPPNVPHEGKAVGDEPFVALDIFYPIREDFIKKIKGSKQ